ncbi:hypothetical protein L0F63_007446 [Massospora cicadina]|nr:hypothetical protein L0F63_007446 [Massospora cicadina]
MVDAGFYYLPTSEDSDRVGCPYCEKHFSGWDANTDPFFTHLQQSRNCCWALCACLPRLSPEQVRSIDEGLLDLFHPARSAARLKTFNKHWPHPTRRGWKCTPVKLARAGFYFTPTAENVDGVTCISCQSILSEWTKDDRPIDSHTLSDQHCEYLIKVPDNLHKIDVAIPSKSSRPAFERFSVSSPAEPAEVDSSISSIDSSLETSQVRRSNRLQKKDEEELRIKLELRRKKLVDKLKGFGVGLPQGEEVAEPRQAEPKKQVHFAPAIESIPDFATTSASELSRPAPLIYTYPRKAKGRRAEYTSSSSSEEELVKGHALPAKRKSLEGLPEDKGETKLPRKVKVKAKPAQKTSLKLKASRSISPRSPKRPLSRKATPSISLVSAIPGTQSNAKDEVPASPPDVHSFGSSNQPPREISSKEPLSEAKVEVSSAPPSETPTAARIKRSSRASLESPVATPSRGPVGPFHEVTNNTSEALTSDVEPPTDTATPSNAGALALKLVQITPQERSMRFGDFIQKLTQDQIRFVESAKRIKFDQLDALLTKFDENIS